jgi:teichuronic acid exporter
MDLRSGIAQALRWSFGARFATQAISWASTLLVIRLLQPEDYGVMAMAMSVLTLANRVNEGGLAASVVQKQEIGRDDLGVVMTFSGLIALALFGIMIVAAPLVSDFYDHDITLILQVAALTLPLRALGRIQEALLIRRFDFRSRALVETIATLVNAFVTLALALLGWRVWSLVLGSLAGAAARAVGFSLSNREPVSLNFDLTLARSHLGFSLAILGQRFLSWASGAADIILIGRFFDPVTLGFYSTAREIAYLPQSKIAAILNQVSFATFSRLQGEKGRLRRAVCRSLEMLSFTMFPIFFAISAYAPEFQRLVLGEKWNAIVLPLQILAFVPPMRMINSHLGELLNGLGKPRATTMNMVFALILTWTAFSVGLSAGILGVAVAAVVTYPVITLLLMRKLVSIDILGWNDLLRPLIVPLAGSATAWLVVILLRDSLPGALPLWQLIGVLGAAGVTTYVGIVVMVAPRRFWEVVSFIRA